MEKVLPAGGERAESEIARIVDFFAHLIYGRIVDLSHDTDPQRVFRSMSERVERIESKLGSGSVQLLYGRPWTDAFSRGGSDAERALFRAAHFSASLFYLDEATHRPRGTGVALNAAAVGAVVAGRQILEGGTKADGIRTMRQLRQSDLALADDGTYERLVEGLTRAGPNLDRSRSAELTMLYRHDLPHPSHRMHRVAWHSEPAEPGLVDADDAFHIVGPVGPGAGWVDQLAVDARATPLSDGREPPGSLAAEL